VDAIYGPLFVFQNYGSVGDEKNKLFYALPKSKWGRYFDDRIHSSLYPKMLDVIQLLVYLKYFLIEPPGS
jgi:hypothetical protein